MNKMYGNDQMLTEAQTETMVCSHCKIPKPIEDFPQFQGWRNVTPGAKGLTVDRLAALSEAAE